MSECLNYPNLTKQNSLVKEMGSGRGVEGDYLITRTHHAVIKHGRVSGKWRGIYFAQTICRLCVFFKSKESCIQKGFVGRSTFILGLDDVSSFIGFLIISGQRYVAL